MTRDKIVDLLKVKIDSAKLELRSKKNNLNNFMHDKKQYELEKDIKRIEGELEAYWDCLGLLVQGDLEECWITMKR